MNRQVVMVRTPGRARDDVEIHRPATPPGCLVLLVNADLTDDEILLAVRGRLDDEELAAVLDVFGLPRSQ